MDFRFYIDPETEQPHIFKHGVAESEVKEVFANLIEDRRAKNDSRSAIGRTNGGRFLRVFYVPEEDKGSVFIITARELGKKESKALRRRMRRRRK